MNPDIQAIKAEAIASAKAAIDAEAKKEWKVAFDNYFRAIEKLKKLKEIDENKYNHQTYVSKAQEYFQNAQKIKENYLNKNISSENNNNNNVNNTTTVNIKNSTSISPNVNQDKDKDKSKNGGKGNEKNTGEKKEELDEDSKKLQESLASCLVTEKPNVHWDDVAGLENAKESLKEAVLLPLKFKHLFNEKRQPWKGILFYGPPGTGKSYLAKACATEVNATFYSVSASNIMSKWVGEAEKTVRALFDLARLNKPAVIFLDEIDSLLSARGDGEQESTRRVKTEFLVQMQGVGKDDSGILVLGATNIPWDLDPAVRRRFQKKIYISLPEHEARYRMFEINLGKTPHNLTEKDINILADKTESFSGSDIATLTQEAIYEPLRTCQTATHFKVVNNKYYVSDPSDKFARKMNMLEIDDPTLLVPPEVTFKDFIKALTRIRPTVTKKDLEKQEHFTDEFGQEG